MPSESDGVSDDETVLRLIYKNHYKPARGPGKVVERGAFEPYRNDNTGVSLFRDMFLARPCHALMAILDETKRLEYAISAMSAREIRSLGFQIVPKVDPADVVPGHAAIVQLTSDVWFSDARRDWVSKVGDLTRLAGNTIIHKPGDPCDFTAFVPRSAGADPGQDA